MKKLMIALAFAGLSVGAVAQDNVEVPRSKYSVVTNSFWSNWFISLGGNYNAFYSAQEDAAIPTSPFIKERSQFGFDVAIGKWFTPGLGLRTKFQGVWGKQVDTRENSPSIKFWNLQEDLMFNMSNLLCGYSDTRVWNISPYVGLGVARNCSYDSYSLTFNFGLLNTWKVSKHLMINLDVYAMATSDKFDGAYNKNRPSSLLALRTNDKLIGASVGLTYNLGKATWEKAPDIAALTAMNKEQMDALNSSLKEQQDENARLREMLERAKNEKQVTKTVEKEVVSTAQSVFFNIGSSKIASRKDLVNVKEVAEYAKTNNAKIVVTGYADSKTGSSSYNKSLSQKRADAVVNELVKMGVSRDNITTQAMGGVNDLNPYSYNRRATVQLQ